MNLNQIEELKFKQTCHRQVIDFMQAWSKKTEGAGKFRTFGLTDKTLTDAILNEAPKADSVKRYDFLQNNLDASTNDFYFDVGPCLLAMRLAPPLMLVFKHIYDNKKERVIVHVISQDLAFISEEREGAAQDFLSALVDVGHADQHEVSNSEEGFEINIGGDF